MSGRRWLFLALAVAGVAWALGGEAVSIRYDVPENHLLDASAGLSFFAGGLMALDRRPGNRLGPLMMLCGVCWFAGNYANLPSPRVWAVSVILGAFQTGLLAHLVLAYPSGRLGTSFERWVVGAAYGVLVGAELGVLLTFDAAAVGCGRCQDVLALWPHESAWHVFSWIHDNAAFVLAPMFFAALWLRWRRSSAAARRELAPLWLVAGILTVVFTLSSFSSNEDTGFGYLLWQIQVAFQVLIPWIFVHGLLSSRLAQSAIGDLVVRLQEPVPPGRLRDLLSETLNDPSVEIAYPLEGDRWVDAEGQPLTPDLVEGRRATPVEREGSPLAVLWHDPALDPALVRASAAAAGMALDNERLHAELRAQLEEVRASRERIVRAGDAERRRVERDLHDGAQQRLLALSLALHAARRQLADGEHGLVGRTLERSGQELSCAIAELRELARGIHPTVLTDAGLAPAVAMVAGRMQIPVDVEVAEERYPATVEATAYFVISEALANVTKHAGATRAGVTAQRRGTVLHVEVCDDGCGGADPARGSGIAGMVDRVAAVGGTLVVDSAPDAGTVVQVDLPCGEPS